jgi:hypothetical protein
MIKKEKETEKNKMKEIFKQIEVQQQKIRNRKKYFTNCNRKNINDIETDIIHFENTLNDYKNKLENGKKEKEVEENKRIKEEER